MKYFNLPCPSCGEPLKEGDDIVVCPECATPQHRECWLKHRACINSHLHSAGFVWSPEASVADDTQPQETAEEQENPEVIICHICGSENPNDSFHCGNCGALFGESESPVITCPSCGDENEAASIVCKKCGALLISESGNPFMNGVKADANELISDYTVEDYALYVQLNAKKYIPKFRKIQKKKLTFNWGAFVFGPNWFLFRKIYKIGIILLIAFASITMMTASFQTDIFEASEKFTSLAQPILEAETLTASDAEIEKIISDYYKDISRPLLILSSIFFIERLLCGFIADKIYYKKINADLKIIDETVEDKGIRQMMIARRGSVSFLAFFAGNLGEQTLLNLFVMAADAISGMF